ncbi:hypothetical protein CHUAL_003512 [Chamberlinius hualienensis]
MLPFIIGTVVATTSYLLLVKRKSCLENTKWYLSYILFRWLNKKRPLFNFDANSTDFAQLGVIPLPIATLRENPRNLSSHKHAIDSIRITGYNKKGDVLCVEVTRRCNRVAEVSVYLRLSTGEEYQLPFQPDTAVFNTDGKSFSAAGLTLEVLEPLRRWRVCFNGYLRKTFPETAAGVDNVVLAKLNLIWIPLLNYVSYPEDYDPELLANYFSTQNICSSRKFYNSLWSQSHEQFGQLKGFVCINGATESQINLRGLKTRLFGIDILENVQQRFSIEGVLHTGSAFHVFLEHVKDGPPRFLSGYVIPSCNMTVHHISQYQIDLDNICNDNFDPNTLTIKFTAGHTKYQLQVDVRKYKCHVYQGTDRQLSTNIYPCDFILNDKHGDGILRFSRSHQHHDHSPTIKADSLTFLQHSDKKETDKLVVSYDEEDCRSKYLVGGKGSSLSLMSNLKQSLATKFTVPRFVCITKKSFEHHLDQKKQLKELVEKFQHIALLPETSNKYEVDCISFPGQPKQLSELCDKMVELIQASEVGNEFKQNLIQKLRDVFGADYEQKYFAIRSSAIGEDGEELSAAGQNDTYLGIRGLEQICTSVVHCWASQFGFRSVEYQRQNGQLLNKGMAVVVQEMVPAEVAGVLFSRDPVTGSPDRITIASNYGLGETIVNAEADADNIVLKRSWDEKLSLLRVTIGSKKVQVNMTDGGGTDKIETSDPSKCSLSEELALKLGEIALYLEKCFGSARDIEWAIKQEEIYLLQSRPVTNENPVIDYEIIHEFDAGMRTDFDVYSTANLGEVCPGACTPLSITSFFRSQGPYLNKQFMWKVDYYKFDPTPNDQPFFTINGNAFMNCITQKSWSLSEKKSETTKALEVGISGHVKDDDDINKLALERYAIRPGFRHNKKILLMTLKGFIFGRWLIPAEVDRDSTLDFILKKIDDPVRCLNFVAHSLSNSDLETSAHFTVSVASSLWNILVLNTLSTGSGEFTTEQYTDFANLVGSANEVESGNVPTSLEELAMSISKYFNAKEFATLPVDSALKLLQESTAEPGIKYKEFIRRHGHRGVKEFDFSSETWGMNPKQVITALQVMLKNGILQIKPKPKVDDVMSRLQSPLTPFKKFMLRLIMKGCRNGVYLREKAKSIIVKKYHVARLGYRRVGQIMTEQAYFTDPNLVFFFTHGELLDLINTRSPKLIRRAKHRQRMHKIMDGYKYPPTTFGEPVPLNLTESHVPAVESGIKITGFPVSQGIVKGPARVVLSLNEVATIQPGEILICNATDIGWTPYFPLLSGVVTEIGGLLSHGAVVARECCLPCIVAVDNATKLFKSGDFVYLNATEGYIMKIETETDQ